MASNHIIPSINLLYDLKMINMKKELKRVGLGILQLSVLIFIIYYFNLSVLAIICLLTIFSAVMMARSRSFTWLKFGKAALTITVLVSLFKWLGMFGFWGFIGIVGLATIYILSTRRKEFLRTKHTIETMLWGKPLKEYIENKEKLPKIEISGMRKGKKTIQPQAE